MRNQTVHFLRALARDAAVETLKIVGVMIALVCVVAAIVGTLFLLGWGAAAVWRWGPTTQEDRGWGTVAVLVIGVGGGLIYACGRDLRYWVLRRWYAAKREVQR